MKHVCEYIFIYILLNIIISFFLSLSKYLHHPIPVPLPKTFIAVPTGDSQLDQSHTALLLNSTNKPFVTTTAFFFPSFLFIWLISNGICLAVYRLQRVIFRNLFGFEFLLSAWKYVKVCKIMCSICSPVLHLFVYRLARVRPPDQDGEVSVKQWPDKS